MTINISQGSISVVKVSLAPKIIAAPVLIGPQGATGATGAPANPTLTLTQNSAALTWTINHNFGYKPSVTIYTAGGQEVEADILHISNNQVQIYFAVAQNGTAYLI